MYLTKRNIITWPAFMKYQIIYSIYMQEAAKC